MILGWIPPRPIHHLFFCVSPDVGCKIEVATANNNITDMEEHIPGAHTSPNSELAALIMARMPAHEKYLSLGDFISGAMIRFLLSPINSRFGRYITINVDNMPIQMLEMVSQRGSLLIQMNATRGISSSGKVAKLRGVKCNDVGRRIIEHREGKWIIARSDAEYVNLSSRDLDHEFFLHDEIQGKTIAISPECALEMVPLAAFASFLVIMRPPRVAENRYALHQKLATSAGATPTPDLNSEVDIVTFYPGDFPASSPIIISAATLRAHSLSHHTINDHNDVMLAASGISDNVVELLQLTFGGINENVHMMRQNNREFGRITEIISRDELIQYYRVLGEITHALRGQTKSHPK